MAAWSVNITTVTFKGISPVKGLESLFDFTVNNSCENIMAYNDDILKVLDFLSNAKNKDKDLALQDNNPKTCIKIM